MKPQESLDALTGDVRDPQTGEVIPFVGPTVPHAAYRDVAMKVTDLQEQVAAERKDRMAAHRRANALQREIDDLLEASADRQVVKTILDFWVKTTGRNAAKTKIPLSGERARMVRWLLRTWTPYEVCAMVVGATRVPWMVERGRSDLEDIATNRGKFSERRAEECLAAGLAALPSREKPAEEPTA